MIFKGELAESGLAAWGGIAVRHERYGRKNREKESLLGAFGLGGKPGATPIFRNQTSTTPAQPCWWSLRKTGAVAEGQGG